MLRGERFTFTVGSETSKIIFKDDGLLDNLQHGHEKLMRAASITAQSMAPAVENYMKNEAPWRDQTGNARAGLQARAFREGDTIGIDLNHSVAYGVYLEAKWSGRYAIIEPTINHMGPIVMARFNRLMERY